MGSSKYRIVVRPAAERDLRGIDPQAIPRISEAIDTLASQPFSPDHRKLKATEHQYRVRVGDYRIIYEVDTDADVIIIHHIRHRRIVYRGLD